MASEESRAGSQHRAVRAVAPLGPVIALSISLALGLLFVVGPLLWRVMPVNELPAPFPDNHQDAESLIYFLAFLVLMPLGILASARVSDRIVAGPNAAALSAVAAALSAGLALVVIATRVSADRTWGGGPGMLAAAVGVWWVVAAVTLGRAAAPRAWGRAASLARHSSALWAGAGVVLVGAVLSFTDFGSISVPVLGVGAVAVVAVVVVGEQVRLPTLPRWLGIVVDLAVIVLIVFAVPNLFPLSSVDPPTPFDLTITQFHQNFYLGPANQVLAGDAMLVDVISQYGVGSIYFLAGAFTLIPISNGTLGLAEGFLSALMYTGTFLVIRVAGVSRLLATATVAVAVVAFVYGLQHPLGALLQHGAIRFGPPIFVVLGAVAESRWPKAATPARALQLLTVAVASIWALEAFAYTLLTVLVVAGFQIAILPTGRRRELARWLTHLVAAIVFGHLVLAGGTLAATEELPSWGWYLNTMRQHLLGELGDWTYDFSSFSPGLALGALYLASGSALALIAWRRTDIVRAERTLLVGIAGMTGYGIALFSYVVNRGADHIIPYVSLPVLALGALWLTLLGRPALDAPVVGRRVALASALGVAALLVAVAWSTAEVRYPQSALAHVVPGGESLAAAHERLWNPSPLRPQAPVGAQLLEQHLPGEDRSIVLTSADLSVEILMRVQRGNTVPLGDPWEDSLVPGQHLDPLSEFIDGLDGGERMLIDAPGRTAFDAYRRRPELDPLAGKGEQSIVPTDLALLQEWVLKEIGQRFDLTTIVRTEDGLEVVELVPRPAAG